MAQPGAALQQPFPQMGTKFVDEQGYVARPWYRLLVDLWKRSGISPGGQPQVQVLEVSPFDFQAPTNGTLLISSGVVAISRDGGETFFPAGTMGGTVPVVVADIARVSWSGALPPSVVFLPTGQQG